MFRMNRVKQLLLISVIGLGLFFTLDWIISGFQSPSGFVSLTAGSNRTCAIDDDGELYCWGMIWTGGFTDESPGNVVFSSAMQKINLLDHATFVAVGDSQTCVVDKPYGTLFCWGLNGYGELGIGRYQAVSEPTEVVNLAEKPISVVAGRNHTCITAESGNVQCWGSNLFGQVGSESVGARILSAVDVQMLDDKVVEIAAGDHHTCALLANGTVRCWGWNSYGQLGDGTVNDTHLPVQVIGLMDDVVSISVGGAHTCAVINNGDVQCWGNNEGGQLGDGTTNDHLKPITVVSLAGFAKSLSAGAKHTCALIEGGQVQCWGNNTNGQLGNRSGDLQLSPALVQNLEQGVLSISAGDAHTCALVEEGRIFCWGDNQVGQLGRARGVRTSSLIAKEIRGLGLRFWSN